MSTKCSYEYYFVPKCRNTKINNPNIFFLMFRWIKIYVLNVIKECTEKKIN